MFGKILINTISLLVVLMPHVLGHALELWRRTNGWPIVHQQINPIGETQLVPIIKKTYPFLIKNSRLPTQFFHMLYMN